MRFRLSRRSKACLVNVKLVRLNAGDNTDIHQLYFMKTENRYRLVCLLVFNILLSLEKMSYSPICASLAIT